MIPVIEEVKKSIYSRTVKLKWYFPTLIVIISVMKLLFGNFGVYLIFPLIVSILYMIYLYVNTKKEKKIWNNGICTHCEKGNLKFREGFDHVLYYECDNCGPDAGGTGLGLFSFKFYIPKKFIEYNIQKMRKLKLKKIKASK